MNRSFHNYLRITRILKCLGEVGLEHFKIHFVQHVLKEIYENRELLNCYESCVKYWVPILRKEEEKQATQLLVEKYEAEKPVQRYSRRPVWDDSDDDDDYKKPTKQAPKKEAASENRAGVQKAEAASKLDEKEKKADEKKENEKNSEDEKKENEKNSEDEKKENNESSEEDGQKGGRVKADDEDKQADR